MLDRACQGVVPPKPHLVFRAETGARYYEECITRGGFDGPFSILYHGNRPHEAEPCLARHGFAAPLAAPDSALVRRHFRCLALLPEGRAPVDARTPLLFNQHVVVGFSRPELADPVYFVNADADELHFVQQGSGLLRSQFGDLRFQAFDYLCIPKGVLHRFVPDAGVSQAWLSLEFRGGLGIPAQYRNAVGQLKMDAPYSHRDFRRPEFTGPLDEAIRELVVKRQERFFGFELRHTPLDVVGWDGSVYPFVFPILAFQPRVGQVHLPPPVHTTFQGAGAVICSFVPRPLDFHPSANPCPYPHSSVDVDEVLFYANGAFASRRGIGAGSLSLHPCGIAHGPHPGAYESAEAKAHTEELAVMLDVSGPLFATAEASAIEDVGYHGTFRAG